MTVDVDVLVLGAGAFGLYGACVAAERGLRVLVVTPDAVPFARASHANQARLHNGYHYPRSVGTAMQSSAYFDRFTEEFPDCMADSFTKIYAIARSFSFTSPGAFRRFCATVEIPVRERDPSEWFRPGTVDAAYECREAGFDFERLRDRFWARATAHSGVKVRFGCRVGAASVVDGAWSVALTDSTCVRTRQVLNATYASTNQVLKIFSQELLPVRYELCEIVLGRPAPRLAAVGITVMDGPFFSVMPFGQGGLHSLSAVDHTPRLSSDERLPVLPCQSGRVDCSPDALADCATCPVRPPSGASGMQQLARRYLHPDLYLDVESSLYAIKPVLDTSVVDDSRPTLIIHHRSDPDLITVFSGKINTVFDLDSLW